MIVVKEFPDRQFSDNEELFKALAENKNTLIAQKKMITKQADAVMYFVMVENGLQADTFMQAKGIEEAWLFRAGGKLYLAWKSND